MRQIAEEFGCSKTSVLNALGEFGIPIRQKSFNHGHVSQPRYGKKYRKKLLIDHDAELQVVNDVKRLRENGMSLRRIAQYLDELRIPTKCAGKEWHPEMVKRILKNLPTTFS